MKIEDRLTLLERQVEGLEKNMKLAEEVIEFQKTLIRRLMDDRSYPIFPCPPSDPVIYPWVTYCSSKGETHG